MSLKLSPKQNEYIRRSTHRWNLKIGAVRSGKSYVDICFVVPSRLRALADKSGLNVILGVSKETIERNVLQPMREIYTDAIVGTINSRNIAMVCGVPVYCLGAEKISQVAKIQGSSIKYCYGDEIAKWNEEVFVMLQSRLDKPYSCFDGSCNPEYPGHWLKGFIDREDIDAYVQKYTLFDNPYLPEEFVDNICREYAGTVYYKRYIDGEWTLAEGLIYPMYEDAIAEAPDGMAAQYGISIDYGTRNAFAAILWGKWGDVWYAVKEYYYSGRDEQEAKTDGEYADDIEAWLSEYFDGVGAPVPASIRTVIDPSAASYITLLHKKYNRYRVAPADNAVADGIRETAESIKRGTIKITGAMKKLIWEMQGYIWDDTSGEDKPVKVNDHACDALRYWCKTMYTARIRSNYKPLWN